MLSAHLGVYNYNSDLKGFPQQSSVNIGRQQTTSWSLMTDYAYDEKCPSDINSLLNNMMINDIIHYTIGRNQYTTRKIDPYTAIQTNDLTKQQRTLKSSLWDNNPDLSSDNDVEYRYLVNQRGEENIHRWYFFNEYNYKQFVDLNLSLKLSNLPIGGSIFHYKTNGFKYNFIKQFSNQVFQRNSDTNTARTLYLDTINNNNSKINSNINGNNISNNNSYQMCKNNQISKTTIKKNNYYFVKNNTNTYTDKSNKDNKMTINTTKSNVKHNNKNPMTTKTTKSAPKRWYFQDDNGVTHSVDRSLCSKFNCLKIGEKLRYWSVYGRYEATLEQNQYGNCYIKQNNLDTGTVRFITSQYSPTGTKSISTTHNTINKNKNNNINSYYNYSCNNYHNNVSNKNNNNYNYNYTCSYNTNGLNTMKGYNCNSNGVSSASCTLNTIQKKNAIVKNIATGINKKQTDNSKNANNTKQTSKIDKNVNNNNNNKIKEENCKQEKNTGYKRLGNLSNEEIEKMFFGINGLDINNYEITEIVENKGSITKMGENIYNSLIPRVRISQQKENNGKSVKETEKWLWHGTNVDVVDKIVTNGFDRNYNTMSAYGVGVYFARNASYSRCYCSNSNKSVHNGDLCMLLCKVIVGDIAQGSYNLRKIPYKNDKITQFETLVDDINDPKIYVVTRDFMAVPKYKIWFRSKSSK